MSLTGKEADIIDKDQYYEYLIDTYQNLVYTICNNIVKNYFDAEDLVQETFLSAYKNLATFDGQYEKAWITRIATNKCLDYLKRAERRSVPTDQEYFLLQENKELSPEENILELELKEQLLYCCNTLKAPYKEVAIDHFYYDLSPTEIAFKTDRNLKTVQTQIYRAKGMLKKIYKKVRRLE